MLLSVVIPIYNAKNFILNCLTSVLNQSFSDFEIVLIDDGSTDGTAKILDKYAEKYEKVNVHHFENAGVSIARQRGLSLANGEYVIFVDSDDTINSGLFEQINKTVYCYNHPDIIRFQSNLVNDTIGKDHDRYNFFDINEVENSGMNALRAWSILNKKYAVYWLYAFKKTIFSSIDSFPKLRCYEDLALIPLLIANSRKVVTIDYVGYNYTCNNSGSLTNSNNKSAEESRAIDFVYAYNYAVSNFKKIKNLSDDDVTFFIGDFNRRLRGKYDSLDSDLKEKFSDLFGF